FLSSLSSLHSALIGRLAPVDRRMKEHRLFEIWILIQALLCSTVYSATKIEHDECKEEMVCFASSACISDSGRDFMASKSFRSDCPAILKIRVYTVKHWLITMESFHPQITSISVAHNFADFLSCKNGEATFKGGKIAETDVLNKTTSPLKCEFLVKHSENIFIAAAQQFSMSTNIGGTSSDIVDNDISSKFRATCDPNMIKKKEGDTAGPKSIIAVDAVKSKVSCPAGFSLEYKSDTGEYVPSDGIDCKAKGLAAFEYVVKTKKGESRPQGSFFAHCTGLTCAQCDYIPTVPAGSVKIVENGGCKTLQCTNNREQLVIGGKNGKQATCAFVKGEGEKKEHLWTVKGAKIETDSTVSCKKVCDKEIIEAMCEKDEQAKHHCIVNKDPTAEANAEPVPHCTGNDLEINGKRGEVTCDKDKGYVVDGVEPLPDNATLTCGKVKEKNPAASKKEEDSGPSTGMMFAYVGCGILLLIIIVLVIICCLQSKGLILNPPAAPPPPDTVKVAAPAATPVAAAPPAALVAATTPQQLVPESPKVPGSGGAEPAKDPNEPERKLTDEEMKAQALANKRNAELVLAILDGGAGGIGDDKGTMGGDETGFHSVTAGPPEASDSKIVKKAPPAPKA
ncbi:hypothetical protein PFISCL1PPCAC_11704, partial [Pristionchus fissidentatus]